MHALVDTVVALLDARATTALVTIDDRVSTPDAQHKLFRNDTGWCAQCCGQGTSVPEWLAHVLEAALGLTTPGVQP